MQKSFICIQCPKSCKILVDFDGEKINSIKGNLCKKGELYVRDEILNPRRILTTTVLTNGLEIKLLPVKTNKPIPKSKLFDAMKEIQKIRVDKPLKAGDIIVKDFIEQGVDLVATRDILKG